jgi:hypothetical protein
LAGNDIINVSNSTGTLGDITIKGGEGNDNISFDGAAGSNESVISSSSVNGGAGNDTIVLVGATSSKVRGNEGADNFTLGGNYTATTINGNAGTDSFGIAVNAQNASTLTLQSAKIHGGADNDGVMNFTNAAIAAAGNDIISAIDSTINGSVGVDNITIGNVGTAVGFQVRGGQGMTPLMSPTKVPTASFMQVTWVMTTSASLQVMLMPRSLVGKASIASIPMARPVITPSTVV